MFGGLLESFQERLPRAAPSPLYACHIRQIDCIPPKAVMNRTRIYSDRFQTSLNSDVRCCLDQLIQGFSQSLSENRQRVDLMNECRLLKTHCSKDPVDRRFRNAFPDQCSCLADKFFNI